MSDSTPYVIGWYHDHEVQIYRDFDNERPWRVVFVGLINESWVGSTDERVGIQFQEEREVSLSLAEDAAQSLAVRRYFRNLSFQRIKWHPVTGA